MKKLTKKWIAFGLIASVLAFGLVGCSTQTKAPNAPKTAKYPEKPISLYVGFTAGGVTDIAARAIATYMEKELGQPITVVNKPGGGGEIAFEQVAKAAPDGYTLGIINSPNIVGMLLDHKTNFTLDDFAYLGNVSFDENVIVAKADGPYKTLEDLLSAATQKPNAITVAHTGVNGDDHLASLLLQKAAKVKFKDLTFEGASPALTALLGGHIDAVVVNTGDIIEQVKQKKLVLLATMGEKRNQEFPDVATLKDKKLDVVAGSYRGIAAPVKTPPEIVAKLKDALQKAASNPEYKQKQAEAKQPVVYIDGDTFSATVKKQYESMKTLDLKK